MSLRKSALSGMFWTFIQQMSTQGIAFVVSIILARILLPSEFGLIALLSVFIALGNVLVNSGLSQSLIRTDNPSDEDYSTVFYFNLIISSIVYIIMFISAPYIAHFYNQPLLANITKIYCITFIINALSIIQNTRLTKDLDFKKQTVITIPSLIIGSIVGITMALYGYGVWSLVWSAIVRSVALTIQLWWWSPWMPSFKFNTEKIKIHLNYGYKLTIAEVIDSLFKDIYTITIGKFFDSIQVGYYNRASTLKDLPTKNFSAVLNRVTFSLFSKIQNDDIQLKNAFRKIMQMAIFLVAPTLLIMAVLATPLISLLLTEKWLPAVPYFQILCFSGILYPIQAYNLNIITVKGRSDLFLIISIVKKILIVIVVVISFQWGIYGLLYGQIFLSCIALFINAFYSGRLINYSILSQIKDIMPALLLSFFSAFIVFLFDKFLFINFSNFFRLFIGGGIGFIIYLLVASFMKLESFKEVKSILLKNKK